MRFPFPPTAVPPTCGTSCLQNSIRLGEGKCHDSTVSLPSFLERLLSLDDCDTRTPLGLVCHQTLSQLLTGVRWILQARRPSLLIILHDRSSPDAVKAKAGNYFEKDGKRHRGRDGGAAPGLVHRAAHAVVGGHDPAPHREVHERSPARLG